MQRDNIRRKHLPPRMGGNHLDINNDFVSIHGGPSHQRT
jgi:hypothetical protein